ncbi:hypothetical protein E2978_21610 (plasmid) [Paracoccus yeei]
MTVPGVGTVTAATFVATIDAPGRFAKSRSVGAYAGLTSRRHQSGAVDYGGRISKRGDRLLRTMLYEAANSLLCRVKPGRDQVLTDWAVAVKRRTSHKKAVVALAQAGFVLDALEQAVHDRRPAKGMGLVHHSDRAAQYLSIRYSERLAEAGIEPSVGSVGDSYDNALAETINGLFKAEVIHRRRPWRSFEAVEYATLEWVDWFNNRGLLEPIGNIPPSEAGANFYAVLETEVMAA